MRRKLKRMWAILLMLTICLVTTDISAFAAESSTLEEQQMVATTNTDNTVSSGNSVVAEEDVNEEKAQDNWDGRTIEAVYEAENYTVTFSLTGFWEGGYHANVKIENTGDSSIENWRLSCDFDNEMANIWNAQIYSRENDKYVIVNAGWNADIAVDGSVEFGFSGNESFRGFPKEYRLLGETVEADEGEYTVGYHVDSDWGNGFTGTISITNNTDTTIEDWILDFCFDRRITQIWNGVIEKQDGNHYIVKNAGHNANILPGQTLSFGFMGENGTYETIPCNYQLESNKLSGKEIDVNKDTDNSPANLLLSPWKRFLPYGSQSLHLPLHWGNAWQPSVFLHRAYRGQLQLQAQKPYICFLQVIWHSIRRHRTP